MAGTGLTFGVTGDKGDFSATIFESIATKQTPQISDAQGEDGKTTHSIAYSMENTVDVSGYVDGAIGVQGGQVATVAGLTGLVTNMTINQSNKDWQKYSATVSKKDNAVLIPYDGASSSSAGA